MTKKFLIFIGVLLLLSLITSPIKVIGSILGFLTLLVIAGCIVFYLVRFTWDAIVFIFRLIPSLILWGLFAIVLAILFIILY